MALPIYSAFEIKKLDKFTIKNQSLTSYQLVRRAAERCVHKILSDLDINHKRITVVAGTGNNGADGILIGAILHNKGYDVNVGIVGSSANGSSDFKTAQKEFLATASEDLISKLRNRVSIDKFFSKKKKSDVIIDALFGSGMNRPIEGLNAYMVDTINAYSATVISIDMPSGVLADTLLDESQHKVEADYTFTFQSPKLGLLIKENQHCYGQVDVVDIELEVDAFYNEVQETKQFFIQNQDIPKMVKKRDRFSHKGMFGHSLIMAGSKGMIGAAQLSGQACLRSGTGLLSFFVPRCGYHILQSTIPEAIVQLSSEEDIISLDNSDIDLSKYDAISLGSGMGRTENTYNILKQVIDIQPSKLLLDADAINVLADHRELMPLLPKDTVLTPHPKEWRRLIGKDSKDSFEDLTHLIEFCQEYQVVVVHKDAITKVVSPDGRCSFIASGNPALATAGTGDVLAGIITGYLAQGYTNHEAAVLGSFMHGYTAQIITQDMHINSVSASDIPQHFGRALKHLTDTYAY